MTAPSAPKITTRRTTTNNISPEPLLRQPRHDRCFAVCSHDVAARTTARLSGCTWTERLRQFDHRRGNVRAERAQSFFMPRRGTILPRKIGPRAALWGERDTRVREYETSARCA